VSKDVGFVRVAECPTRHVAGRPQFGRCQSTREYGSYDVSGILQPPIPCDFNAKLAQLWDATGLHELSDALSVELLVRLVTNAEHI
jgi:hypothetical protein